MNQTLPTPTTASTTSNDTPRLSIVIVQHHNRTDLERLLPTIFAQAHPSYEIIVVDNAHTDGTAQWLTDHYPEVRVFDSGGDLGFSGGINVGLGHVRGQRVLAMNPDVELHPGCLELLERTLDAHPNALVNPLCLLPDGRVNTFGNQMHYTGIVTCRYLEADPETLPAFEHLPLLTGTAILARREVFEHLGGFDANFFMYLEDSDLSLRARAAGYDLIGIRDARITHHWKLKMSPHKFGLLERNRLLTLWKVCSSQTLWRLTPALLLTALATWCFALLRGPAYLRAKWDAYAWLVQHRQHTRAKARAIQSTRTLSDAELFHDTTSGLPFDQLLPNATAVRWLEVLTGPLYHALRPQVFCTPRVALFCSQGGHFTEMTRLLPGLQEFNPFIVSYHSSREAEVRSLAEAHFIPEIGTNITRMLHAFWLVFGILWRERPSVIITTGAEIGLPAMYLGKLFGARTVYIESLCRVRSKSLTGKLVYPIVDDFLVQWPEMVKVYGPKAKFEGAVI